MNKLPSWERLEQLLAEAEKVYAPLWTILQVAEYMGTTWGAVHKLIERHAFPHFKIEGALRFDPGVVQAWVVRNHEMKGKWCRCRGRRSLRGIP